MYLFLTWRTGTKETLGLRLGWAGQPVKTMTPWFFNLYGVWLNCNGHRESTKHRPPPWTGSIKIWTGSMDPLSWTGSMDPLIMDRVHGPPIFTSWGCTINYDLMTFDDTLRDGSSFGKPCTSLIAHLPLKFMLNSSFSLLLVIFKHTGWFSKV